MSMSYKERLSHLDRTSDRSVTAQIADAFAAAIDAGELAPGDQLPPTRELAELAGVNHLTAARAYRKLAELGLVSGRVGRGTFVRQTAPRRRTPSPRRATARPGSYTRSPTRSRPTPTGSSARCSARPAATT